MSNNELLDSVKSWLSLDNDIRNLQKQIKLKRKEKKSITTNLVDIMKSNDIDQLNIPDGELVYTKTKSKAPLSKKHLLASISTFFQNSNDPRLVQELSTFIMNSRKEKEKENIKRKIKNKK